MSKLISFVVLIILQQALFAQDIAIPLWNVGSLPNYQKTNEVETHDSGSAKIRMVQTPDIAVYLPSRNTATGQAIIICPGGGYNHLSYKYEGKDVAAWLISKGVAAIVLKYRLPNSKSNVVSHLSPLLDAKRAMRIVRSNASHWGINKSAVGIMGFSAGGHLASTLATQFDEGDNQAKDSIEIQSSRPDFVILAYPVISMSKPVMHSGSRNNLIGEHPDSLLALHYSNELQVKKTSPPTFLVHAMDDKSVPMENSLFFFQAMKENGIRGELHVFPKGGHGFGLGLGKGSLEKWTDLCIEWLRGLVPVANARKIE